MNARSNFTRWASLGLVLGALATPAAQATNRPDDRAGSLGVNTSTAIQSSAIRPDNRAGTLGVGTQPVVGDTSDVVSRYLRSHPISNRPDDRAGPLGVGMAGAVMPDVLERYAAAHPYGSGLSSPTGSTIVGRPPDIGDAAEAAEAISTNTSGAFHWGDYSAGIGTGIGSVLLLAGGLTITPRLRRRTRTT